MLLVSKISPRRYTKNPLSHHHIEYHHEDKTNSKADGAEIRVLTAGGFWDEFLYNHIEHGSCGKSEHVREDRRE